MGATLRSGRRRQEDCLRCGCFKEQQLRLTVGQVHLPESFTASEQLLTSVVDYGGILAQPGPFGYMEMDMGRNMLKLSIPIVGFWSATDNDHVSVSSFYPHLDPFICMTQWNQLRQNSQIFQLFATLLNRIVSCCLNGLFRIHHT